MALFKKDGEKLRLLADILRKHAELVATGHTLDETLAQLANGASALAGVTPPFGLIRVIDPDRLVLRQDIQGDGVVSRAVTDLPVGDGVSGRAMVQRRVQIVDDVRRDKSYVPINARVRSELAVPLMAGGRCWGVLNLESDRLRHFRADGVSWIEAIASQAAITIQYDALRAREERERAANNFGTDVDRLQAELGVITAEALKVLGGKRASVEVQALPVNADALITLAFATDNPLGTLPGRFAPDSTIAWQGVRQNRPVHLPEIAAGDPRTSVSGSRAALALPLRGPDGSVIGVFNVEAPQPHALDSVESTLYPYCQRAENVLLETGEDARTAAMSSASLMAELGRQITNLVDPRDLDTFYQQVLRRVAQMVGGHRLAGAIALFESGELTITPERTYNYSDALRRTWSWSAEKGLTGQAVRTRESVLVPDVRAAGSSYLVQDETTRCELVVPLLRNQAVVGVIDLISPDVGAITDTHRQMVEHLASQVVQALDRAEQIRRGQMAEQRLQLIRSTNEGIESMLRVEHIADLRPARERVLRQLLDAAMKETGSQFGAIMAAVLLPQQSDTHADGDPPAETSAEMVLMLAHPPTTDIDTRLHWPVTRGVTGEVYRTGKYIKVEDVRNYTGNFVPLFGDQTRADLAVPMKSGTRVLGVLNLESTGAQTYSPEQVTLVELLASQVVNVMSSADLYLARAQLVRLLDLERDVMIESLRDDDGPINRGLQRRILQAALDLTEQTDGYASLWLSHGSNLHRYDLATTEAEALERESVATTTGGIVGIVRETQQPVLVLDVDELPWRDIILRNWQHTRSELAVPLLDPHRQPGDPARVIGVLNIESRRKLDFSERDIDILQPLAQAAIVAMRNRELFRGKVNLLRDVTHAFEKALWPLMISVDELHEQVHAPQSLNTAAEQYRGRVDEIASLTSMASNLLGWFQQLVLYEDGGMAIPMQPAHIEELVSQIVDQMAPFARNSEKQLRLIPLNDDFEVRCASDLVQAALFLLIENALAYSPPHDTIIITARQLPSGAARIEVLDHGTPIPEAEREFIFDAGFRGSASLSPHARGKLTGSGVGLEHVRRIVEQLHHGKAGYIETGDGNVFFIELAAVADQ